MENKDKIKRIVDLSNEIHSYFHDESALFAKVNSIDKAAITKLLSWYIPNDESVQPVNLFRYILAHKLNTGVKLTPTIFNQIKSELEQRNVGNFDFLTDKTKQFLINYPVKTKSFFVQWSNPARILFPFFYSEDLANTVFGNCKEIAEQVIHDIKLTNVDYHPVDFQGSQNYGGDAIWVAIYPKARKDHRQSYQLFFRIEAGKFMAGLAKGSGIDNDAHENNFEVVNTYEELIQNLSSKIPTWQEWNEELNEVEVVKAVIPMQETSQMEDTISLNKILYGPPGTGKTYNTISEAIKIVDPEFYSKNSSNRDALQNKFNELLITDWNNTKGQIAFCTFHQSFSYEDFVEGIKPKTENKQVTYEVEPGIFKNICKHAVAIVNAQKDNLLSLTQAEFNQAVFYKLSLGDTAKEEGRTIYDYCIKHNVISIGFGQDHDLTNKTEEDINAMVTDNLLDTHAAQSLNYFKNYLKVGNYVVISNGNNYIRAIGKVTGEYRFEDEGEIGWDHFRSVEWLFSNVDIPVNEFYQNGLSQKTIYKLKKEFIIPSFFVKTEKNAVITNHSKNFVLIIDEINRGNVSSIFGELITLIEPTKRAGQPEALEVVLPYSKTPFTVPSNVYLVGTMNTADRSIESLDTALRRRFSFKEMAPKSGLIVSEGKSKGVIDGIDLVKMLDKMNDRIEKLIDKDHKIGHSYFISISTIKELQHSFKDKVIPLLEEYFFGDFGKIGLVLGNSFVKKEANDFEFAKFEDYDSQTEQDLKQRAIFTIKPVGEWNFKSIYE